VGAVTALGFEFSVLRIAEVSWRVNLPGSQAPPRKRLGVKALRIVPVTLLD
jgi:hypothetical protein